MREDGEASVLFAIVFDLVDIKAAICGEKAAFSGVYPYIERVMGLEPTISCLGSKRSTTELHPHGRVIIPARMTVSRLAVQEQVGQLE